MTHLCHWPGCQEEVPPALWGCGKHWFLISKPLRDKIWRHYRKGQELDKKPSKEYIEAAREVQDWILIYEQPI